MKKMPVFILAAATVLSIAGAPMTAQAASCYTSYSNCFSSNCYGQYGNFNLSQYGCSNSRNCYTSGRNGSSCYGSNSCYGRNSAYNSRTTSNRCSSNFYSRSWR